MVVIQTKGTATDTPSWKCQQKLYIEVDADGCDGAQTSFTCAKPRPVYRIDSI